MKIIFADTETTGLLDFTKGADAIGQPRICGLAWLVYDTIAPGGDPALSYYLIKPDGWTVPAAAVEIHGLTTDRLMAEGKPIAEVLEHFCLSHDDCETIGGFGVEYDLKMLRGELRRADMKDRYGELAKIDVMRMAQKVCKLPPTAKMRGGFKPPTLAEAHRILLGREMTEAHNAAADVLATVAIYRHLMEQPNG